MNKYLILMAYLLVVSSVACNQANLNDRRSDHKSKSKEESNGSSGLSESEEEDPPKSDSVPIMTAGTSLLDFDNSQLRCDFSELEHNKYKTLCSATMIDQEGNERKPEGLAPNVQLSWKQPAATKGDVEILSCTETTDLLNFSCNIVVKTFNHTAEVRFDLEVSDSAASRNKTESSFVLLPFSVGVAAGFVPSAPISYHAAKEEVLTVDNEEEGFSFLGFQLASLPPEAIEVKGVSVCRQDGYTFFANGNKVFALHPDDQVRLFAGSDHKRLWPSSHRLKFVFGDHLYLACHKDHLFVSDQDNDAVYVIDQASRVSEMPGKFSKPGRIAALSDGGVAVVDQGHGRIVVSNVKGKVRTILGQGSENETNQGVTLSNPDGIAVTDSQEIIVADTGNHRIIRYDLVTHETNMIEREGSAPSVIKAYGNDVFVLESGSQEFVRYSTSDVRVPVFGASATKLQVLENGHVADFVKVDETEWLFVDRENDTLVRALNGATSELIGFDLDALSKKLAGHNARSSIIRKPQGIAITESQQLFILDSQGKKVQKILPDGSMSEYVDLSTLGPQVEFEGVTLTIPSEGFSDSLNSKNPKGIVATPQGDVYIVDEANHRVLKIDGDNNLSVLVGKPFLSIAGRQEGDPRIVAILQKALEQYGYEYFKNIAQSQSISVEESWPLKNPSALTLMNDGSLLIADTGHHQIKRYYPKQDKLVVVAGTGSPGVSGDGDDAPLAQLNQPTSVAVDRHQNIYIADTENDRIRMINGDGKISTIASNLHSPRSLVVSKRGEIFFVDDDGLKGQIRTLMKDPSRFSEWEVHEFWNDMNQIDCGTGHIMAKANKGKTDEIIRASLSVMCKGQPIALALNDTCDKKDGYFRLLISQYFENQEIGNVVEVNRSCQSFSSQIN